MKVSECSVCGKGTRQGFPLRVPGRRLTTGVVCPNCVGVMFKSLSDNAVTMGVDTQESHHEAEVSVPYGLSEKCVTDMWVGVKEQAEQALDLLFANAVSEISEKNGVTSKWIVVVHEDRVHFKRFENGAIVESYAPVSPVKAAVYATAIVNGLQPPRDLRPCDKPTG